MRYIKSLETKYLELSIDIMHHGKDNHERINASVDAVNDFNNIIHMTMSFLKNHINSWEKEHVEAIERVGK